MSKYSGETTSTRPPKPQYCETTHYGWWCDFNNCWMVIKFGEHFWDKNILVEGQQKTVFKSQDRPVRPSFGDNDLEF